MVPGIEIADTQEPPSMTSMTPTRIRDLMSRWNLSGRRLAGILSVSETTVYRWTMSDRTGRARYPIRSGPAVVLLEIIEVQGPTWIELLRATTERPAGQET